MPSNVDTRVTPSLHPHNVQEIEGYNDATAPYLAATDTAFSAAYEGLLAVHDARTVVNKNPAWNEEQRIVQVSKFAEKKLDQITRGLDKARGDLLKNIEQVERELTAPIEAKAVGNLAAEIRAHVKGLPAAERHAFVMNAVNGLDSVTVGALLGAPAYLSGVSVEMQKVYLRQYRGVMAPELTQRLKAMQNAVAMIDERGRLVFAEMEKAVGAAPNRAAALRKAHEAASKALELT